MIVPSGFTRALTSITPAGRKYAQRNFSRDYTSFTGLRPPLRQPRRLHGDLARVLAPVARARVVDDHAHRRNAYCRMQPLLPRVMPIQLDQDIWGVKWLLSALWVAWIEIS